MNLRACLVLKEEFPMSIPFIQESSQEDSYLLKAKVQSYLGQEGLCWVCPRIPKSMVLPNSIIY